MTTVEVCVCAGCSYDERIPSYVKTGFVNAALERELIKASIFSLEMHHEPNEDL